MDRDFIVVFGNQGFGKSVWKKSYTASKTRLLEYDPLAADSSVDFVTDPSVWGQDVLDGNIKTFRYGTYYREELPLFGSLAFAVGECTFSIEECGTLFVRGERMDQWLSDLVFMGRHPQVNLICVAQRASSVLVDVRSQAQRIVTFLQTEPNDVKALCDRVGSEYEEEIRSLPKLHCMDFDMTTGTVDRYAVTP